MSRNVKLVSEGSDNYVRIPKAFFDDYLPDANGEFVKIYLYLLRWLPVRDHELSLESIADTFNLTDADVTRALRYWEKKGLLTLSYADGADHAITAICLMDLNRHSEEAQPALPETPAAQTAMAQPALQTEPAPQIKAAPAAPAAKHYEKKTYSMEQISSICSGKEGSELIGIIQAYLGRTLSETDLNMICFFTDELGFSNELIEYLFEYCVNNNHTNMRYIEKTAIGWAEEGIKTAEEAHRSIEQYNGTSFAVMKALGLGGRRPATSEAAFIRKWFHEYGFEKDMVLEACARTIRATHSPSFEYTDRILSNWKEKGIDTLEAVKRDDEARARSKSAPAKTAKRQGGQFGNFQQRSYSDTDLDKIFIRRLQSTTGSTSD
ncbi:MAG: DnaD domain protein [Lachnospiraceae bacterium]|jgi:DnaD/phage-associated family protein